MYWNQIVRFHRNPPSIKIKRSPRIQEEYNIYLSNPQNIIKLRENLFRNNYWELRPNDFPYYFADNTKCYVLWCQLPLDYNGIEFIIQNYTDFQDYIYFINERNNKSIHSIFHAHIFVK
tara:strand:+ start:3279 stop:3635 length:357 start_codon:yes stop_codon:yes gene_type:complete